jgi:hypothetical protein
MASCGGNCVSNDGYIDAARKQAAAIKTQAVTDIAIQTAIALWQRNSSKSVSNMQTQLANQQVELAEKVLAHAQIFWVEEAELIADIFAQALIDAPYAALGGAWGNLATDALSQARQVWLDTSRRWCFAPSRCEDTRWQRNLRMIEVDLTSYGHRQAEARQQILNDRRYARQVEALGMGRGKVPTLTSYQSISSYSGLSASDTLEAGINSSLTAFGYYRPLTSQPVGWGQGIQETWSNARLPSIALENNGWNGQPLAPPSTLPPVSRLIVKPEPVAPEPAPLTGKAGEWQGLNWEGL